MRARSRTENPSRPILNERTLKTHKCEYERIHLRMCDHQIHKTYEKEAKLHRENGRKKNDTFDSFRINAEATKISHFFIHFHFLLLFSFSLFFFKCRFDFLFAFKCGKWKWHEKMTTQSGKRQWINGKKDERIIHFAFLCFRSDTWKIHFAHFESISLVFRSFHNHLRQSDPLLVTTNCESLLPIHSNVCGLQFCVETEK